MGYRKITVDGVEHQYTVGKTHVKVRGMQAVPKETVGIVETRTRYCECCNEPLTVLGYTEEQATYKVLLVRPSDIADFIRKETRHLVSG